jgi:hypothetical protein
MTKVINRKRYDTEKAKIVAFWDNGYLCNDLYHYSETLYVTAKGNYFLFGSGGSFSKYSCSIGSNGRGGASDIIPMSRHEAFVWAQGHASDDELAHFDELIEEA